MTPDIGHAARERIARACLDTHVLGPHGKAEHDQCIRPLAFEQGTGSELRNPLGITIIGGLLLSQLLTLYTTPVIYLAMDRIKTRLSPRQALQTELDLSEIPEPSQRAAE